MYLHVVTGTKHRTPWLSQDVQPRLWAYIGGIVRVQGGTALEVGGMQDHVHLLVRWQLDESIASLARHFKARSSRWLHATFPELREFAWQSGYGVFSVRHSSARNVRAYIRNQAEHHKTRTYKEEFLALLRAHEVEFHEEEVFAEDGPRLPLRGRR